MADLFAVLAGKSKDTFSLGGIKFMAAPLSLAENAEYNALATVQVRDGQGNVVEIIAEDARAEFWADKLKRRIQSPTDHSPDGITSEWFMANIDRPTLLKLEHVMFYGTLPQAGGNTKAP